MATPRKSSPGRSRASGKASKPGRAPKSTAPAPPKLKAKLKSAGKAETRTAPAAHPDHLKAKPAAPHGKGAPAGKPLPPKSKSAVKPSHGGKKGANAPPAEVRPLGVLPPSSIARGVARPAAPAPIRPRPAATRPSVTPSDTQGAQRVSEHDLKDFETRLLNERRKILKEMGHLENTVLKVNPRDSAGDLSGYSFHMADAGTDAMEREKAFLFASAEGRTLLEINEALRRVYRGEYGVCESCGQPIARARLEAMPHARLCVPCKEKEERAHRGAV